MKLRKRIGNNILVVVASRYYAMDKGAWPHWSVGALAVTNPAFSEGPTEGCGYVFHSPVPVRPLVICPQSPLP